MTTKRKTKAYARVTRRPEKSRIQQEWHAIIRHKLLSPTQVAAEVQKVLTFQQGPTEVNSFVGNKLIYHYQLLNLCKTARKGKYSLYDIYHNANKQALVSELHRATRARVRAGKTLYSNLFECWRINNGSISIFKMCNATYMYKKYGATKVLDVTAGWGGRMLAAYNLGISYTGFDTNTSLQPGYKALMQQFPPLTRGQKINIFFKNVMNVDFTKLDYDFVLTSPPYEDLEVYEHTPEYNDFYADFLIPLLNKCRQYIKKGGWTCFNISPQMYAKLTGEKYSYSKCVKTENLLEQKNGKTADMIYMWRPL
jgi:hypothetical protein